MIALSENLSVSDDALLAARESVRTGSLDALRKLGFSHEDSRALALYARDNKELDDESTSVSQEAATNMLLLRKIDRVLDEEVERVRAQMPYLVKISTGDPTKLYKLPGTQQEMTAGDAQEVIDKLLRNMLLIKKSISEASKAVTPQTAVQINNTVDMEGIVSSAIKEIRARGVDNDLTTLE